jgi:hypothetical protein
MPSMRFRTSSRSASSDFPVMRNPWDMPPLASEADPHEDMTYSGVGRVVTEWESIEMELCLLLGAIQGVHRDQALDSYGDGTMFRSRVTALKAAAAKRFISKPCQHTEGTFEMTMEFVEGFSQRRNDVAHGMVLDVTKISFFRFRLPVAHRSLKNFLLIPPLYWLDRHDEIGRPEYAYSSKELLQIANSLHRLRGHIRALRFHLLGSAQS